MRMPSSQFGEPWILKEAKGAYFYSANITGKWCVFCEPAEIDERWLEICQLLDSGLLLAAKVSTEVARRITGHSGHVICIYTKDWRDEEDVFRTLAVLREAGFSRPLKYKRDIDTMDPSLNPDREFFYEG